MPYYEGQNPEETAETVDTEAVKPEESRED